MSVIVEVVRDGPQGPAGPAAIRVHWTGTAWPARPATTITQGAPVWWIGGTTEPPGALDGDLWVTG